MHREALNRIEEVLWKKDDVTDNFNELECSNLQVWISSDSSEVVEDGLKFDTPAPNECALWIEGYMSCLGNGSWSKYNYLCTVTICGPCEIVIVSKKDLKGGGGGGEAKNFSRSLIRLSKFLGKLLPENFKFAI